ncbi:MAG: histidinol dehydrogenase, partial [Phycisphaerae bacterium]
MSIQIINYRQADFDAKVAKLRDRLRSFILPSEKKVGINVRNQVAEILEEVRTRRDEALVDWESRLDDVKLTPTTLRVPSERIKAAVAQADSAFMTLARRVAANIRRYQKRIRVKAPAPLRCKGRKLSVRYIPIDRVGVYVPGGRALYPSTLLMTVVPAQVAGVKEIAICSPPTDHG